MANGTTKFCHVVKWLFLNNALVPAVTFSKLQIDVNELRGKLEAVAETDVRDAHGEPVTRLPLENIPTYLYEAVVQDVSSDRVSHEAEVDAQRGGP